MEIMIVLGILAILVGAVAIRASGFLGDAREKRVMSDFKSLESTLGAYQVMAGHYPSDAQGLEALIREPNSDPKPRRWRQLLKKADSLQDPWGTNYRYQRFGSQDQEEPEILCAGQDQVFGTKDDLSSQQELE